MYCCSYSSDDLRAMKIYADLKCNNETDNRKELLKIMKYIRDKMRENNQDYFNNIDASTFWIKEYIKNNPLNLNDD